MLECCAAQAGYGVGANGQGIGVNHMGGVQGVAGVNGQVKKKSELNKDNEYSRVQRRENTHGALVVHTTVSNRNRRGNKLVTSHGGGGCVVVHWMNGRC